MFLYKCAWRISNAWNGFFASDNGTSTVFLSFKTGCCEEIRCWYKRYVIFCLFFRHCLLHYATVRSCEFKRRCLNCRRQLIAPVYKLNSCCEQLSAKINNITNLLVSLWDFKVIYVLVIICCRICICWCQIVSKTWEANMKRVVDCRSLMTANHCRDSAQSSNICYRSGSEVPNSQML